MHITDLYFRGFRTHPERLALSGDGGDFTYRQTFALTNRIGRRLRDGGFGTGDRFAVLSPNTGRAFIAMLGGLRAGVAWCNLNMKAALPDILHILAAGRCNLLFFHESAAGMIDEIRAQVPSLRDVVCIGGGDPRAPSLEQWLGDTSDAPLDLRVPETSQGFQGATGGTTGRSKLTVASNRFMMTGVMAWATCLHFDEPPVNLAVAPITHAGGFVALGMGQFGGTTIMMSTPDVGEMIALIEQRRVTTLFEGSRFLLMDGWGHGAIGNTCVTAAFDDYYATGALPREGTVCEKDYPLFGAFFKARSLPSWRPQAG